MTTTAPPVWRSLLFVPVTARRYVDGAARRGAHLVEHAEWLRRFLVRLSARHEARNPVAWRMQDLPKAYVETMLKGIVGLDIAVTWLEGKYKLSQNRPAADRPGLIAALESQGDFESRAVARLMRDREPV